MIYSRAMLASPSNYPQMPASHEAFEGNLFPQLESVLTDLREQFMTLVQGGKDRKSNKQRTKESKTGGKSRKQLRQKQEQQRRRRWYV